MVQIWMNTNAVPTMRRTYTKKESKGIYQETKMITVKYIYIY